MNESNEFIQDHNRRQFFRRGALSFGSMALANLLHVETFGARKPTVLPRKSHFAPKAKRVIYLHMIGAPSHLDMWDYKPELQKWTGKPCPPSLLEGRRFAMINGGEMSLIGTPWSFDKYGQSGMEISELLPHMRSVADDVAVVKTVHGRDQSRTRADDAAFRLWSGRPAQLWIVGHLRFGNTQPEHARICLVTDGSHGRGWDGIVGQWFPSQCFSGCPLSL